MQLYIDTSAPQASHPPPLDSWDTRGVSQLLNEYKMLDTATCPSHGVFILTPRGGYPPCPPHLLILGLAHDPKLEKKERHLPIKVV